MIRVLGGRLRGRQLRLPPGARSRPSSAKLREALFSVLADRIEGRSWMDLFAGSGSFGIEVLSRGASSCRFVEIEPRCVARLKENLREFELGPPQAIVHRADARRWLRRVASGETQAFGAFADPPYDEEVLLSLLPLAVRLLESGRLHHFVLEHAGSIELESIWAGFDDRIAHATRRYGHGAFTLLERRS